MAYCVFIRNQMFLIYSIIETTLMVQLQNTLISLFHSITDKLPQITEYTI